MSFNSFEPQVVFQEVPEHISLAFTITGCQLGCKGCHSASTWNANIGLPLTSAKFEHYLTTYSDLIACVLFFGGEWQLDTLIQRLKQAKNRGLKTCLYTGLDILPAMLTPHLDFAKTGRWEAKRGGLASPLTNQKFINLNTGELLNYRFLGKDNACA